MIDENILKTPLGDYQLVDFGAGRKLERFGSYLLDRPAPQATGTAALSDWQADWCFSGQRIADGEWQALRPDLANSWVVELDDQRMHVRLGKGGQVGIYPEHVVCWRWVRERLQASGHSKELDVLNLFAGTGGSTAAATISGAAVTHVDAQAAQIELAKQNVGEHNARWIREDVMTYVERAVRRNEQYHLLIMDPPSFGRGPKGKVWDIEVDLHQLMQLLPDLINSDCRGIWLSLHTPAYSVVTLQELLQEIMPQGSVQGFPLGIATQDGRVLASGIAAIWFDDDAVS